MLRIPDKMMATLNQARTLLFSDKQKEEALAADLAQAEEEAYAEQEKRHELASKAKDDEPRRQDT